MNDTHYEILKRSVDEWNEWRAKNWEIVPDLSGANLKGMSLIRANLERANLTGANLQRAELIGVSAIMATFEGALMQGAKLQGADLSKANLTNALLTRANLIGATFKEANLINADLTATDCTGAKFDTANLAYATFYNVIVKGANFQGSNVFEADLYADQFRDANIPLEMLHRIEKKHRTIVEYAKFFIALGITIIFLFSINMGILQSETPGDFNTKIRANLYLQVGAFYDSINSLDASEYYLEKSKKYDPDNPHVYYVLGGVYRRDKNPEKAVANYRKFMEKSLSGPEADGIREYIYQQREKLK